ncbi:hypothetical protein [Spirosoma endophyticum]|nr:hypothetical protein [Spirosoma endophyticum]
MMKQATLKGKQTFWTMEEMSDNQVLQSKSAGKNVADQQSRFIFH